MRTASWVILLQVLEGGWGWGGVEDVVQRAHTGFGIGLMVQEEAIGRPR